MVLCSTSMVSCRILCTYAMVSLNGRSAAPIRSASSPVGAGAVSSAEEPGAAPRHRRGASGHGMSKDPSSAPARQHTYRTASARDRTMSEEYTTLEKF